MVARTRTPAPPPGQRAVGPHPAGHLPSGHPPAAGHRPAGHHQTAHHPAGHHQAHPHQSPRLLDRRIIGVSTRSWIIIGFLIGLCYGIYEASNPVTPNAFDQPGAQVPNRLRSPWGVQNPL